MRIRSSLITAFLIAGPGTTAMQAQNVREHPGFVQQRIDELRLASTTFAPVTLFSALPKTAERDALWQGALDHATLLSLDKHAMADMLRTRPAYMSLALPSPDGTLTLQLEEVDPFTDDFSVVTASNGLPFSYTQGLHYRGVVQGDANSLVAISIFKDEVMGFVSNAHGDLTIGKLDGDANGTHVLYRTSDLRNPPMPVCGTVDDGTPYTKDQLRSQGSEKTAKCVRIYWEVNYDIFTGKGSVANATNYVTGLFNQSAVLYNNDGISVLLSQVYVWDVASPYTATSTSDLLDEFGAYRTSFNGDIANLLGYAGGGGIAWLSGLCISSTAHKMAYSGISTSYSNVPTFSWSVEVVTHEQGHILGSKHTHACAWNGNNTAIDGCGPAAGYTEGTCAAGPVPSPSVGGTIMSYCHLVSAGINFNNGFGPQPLAVIINNINNATCLTACTGTTCGTPAGLAAASVTTTSAALSWGAVSGATSYSLQWKPTSASTWTTVTGLTAASYSLTNLTANTAYQFQVLAVCSSGSSVYSAATSFTTLGTSGCPDIQEANNTMATAGSITSGTTYNALIASATDVDYYKLVVTGTSNITVSLSNLPFDFDLKLLNSSGTQLASSANGSTTAESITYANAAAGTYYVYVYGYNGAFSATSCYAVVATATAVVATCTDNYEPNETTGAARTIAPNGNTITGKIATAADIDWFKFANTAAQRYIKVTLTNLPANYDMKLYRASGLLVTAAHTDTNEQIIYNSNTVSSNYKVKVYGTGGAFNASSCYTLTVQLSATAFPPSGGLEEEVVNDAGTDGAPVVAVFPNPANELLNVVIPASEAVTAVDVMDAMGRTVNSFTAQATGTEQRVILDIRSLSDGIYFVRVSQNGEPVVQRLVVQH